MANVKIKNVGIKIGKKTIRMTTEQAMEMQAELNRVFPIIPIYSFIVPQCPCPQTEPYYPIITWGDDHTGINPEWEKNITTYNNEITGC